MAGRIGRWCRADSRSRARQRQAPPRPRSSPASREDRKRADAELKKKQRADQARRAQIEALELRIADTERDIRQLEETMGGTGFYEDRMAAQPMIDRHQALMWEVGELMGRWEALQSAADVAAP